VACCADCSALITGIVVLRSFNQMRVICRCTCSVISKPTNVTGHTQRAAMLWHKSK
jgi:hypothetical protein